MKYFNDGIVEYYINLKNGKTAVLILDGDMVDDTPVNVLHELWRMGITGQCVLSVLCLGRIVLLFIQLV